HPRRSPPLRGRLPPPAPRLALVRVDLRRARGRRAGAAARALAALRLGRALPGRVAGGARGRPGGPGPDGALQLRPSGQGGTRLTVTRSGPSRKRFPKPHRTPIRDVPQWKAAP